MVDEAPSNMHGELSGQDTGVAGVKQTIAGGDENLTKLRSVCFQFPCCAVRLILTTLSESWSVCSRQRKGFAQSRGRRFQGGKETAKRGNAKSDGLVFF